MSGSQCVWWVWVVTVPDHSKWHTWPTPANSSHIHPKFDLELHQDLFQKSATKYGQIMSSLKCHSGHYSYWVSAIFLKTFLQAFGNSKAKFWKHGLRHLLTSYFTALTEEQLFGGSHSATPSVVSDVTCYCALTLPLLSMCHFLCQYRRFCSQLRL